MDHQQSPEEEGFTEEAPDGEEQMEGRKYRNIVKRKTNEEILLVSAAAAALAAAPVRAVTTTRTRWAPAAGIYYEGDHLLHHYQHDGEDDQQERQRGGEKEEVLVVLEKERLFSPHQDYIMTSQQHVLPVHQQQEYQEKPRTTSSSSAGASTAGGILTRTSTTMREKNDEDEDGVPPSSSSSSCAGGEDPPTSSTKNQQTLHQYHEQQRVAFLLSSAAASPSFAGQDIKQERQEEGELSTSIGIRILRKEAQASSSSSFEDDIEAQQQHLGEEDIDDCSSILAEGDGGEQHEPWGHQQQQPGAAEQEQRKPRAVAVAPVLSFSYWRPQQQDAGVVDNSSPRQQWLSSSGTVLASTNHNLLPSTDSNKMTNHGLLMPAGNPFPAITRTTFQQSLSSSSVASIGGPATTANYSLLSSSFPLSTNPPLLQPHFGLQQAAECRRQAVDQEEVVLLPLAPPAPAVAAAVWPILSLKRKGVDEHDQPTQEQDAHKKRGYGDDRAGDDNLFLTYFEPLPISEDASPSTFVTSYTSKNQSAGTSPESTLVVVACGANKNDAPAHEDDCKKDYYYSSTNETGYHQEPPEAQQEVATAGRDHEQHRRTGVDPATATALMAISKEIIEFSSLGLPKFAPGGAAVAGGARTKNTPISTSRPNIKNNRRASSKNNNNPYNFGGAGFDHAPLPQDDNAALRDSDEGEEEHEEEDDNEGDEASSWEDDHRESAGGGVIASSPSTGGAANDGSHQGQQEKQWMLRYSELVLYRAEHGHCNVPFGDAASSNLAKWIKRQRYQYKCKVKGKNSHLTSRRQELLEGIGLQWDQHVAAWENNFISLQAFHRENANCKVSSRENKQLLAWCKRQRRQYRSWVAGRSSTLTEDRIRRLSDLGFFSLSEELPSPPPATTGG